MPIRYSTYGIDPRELKTVKDFEEAHRQYWAFIAREKLLYKPYIMDINTKINIHIHSKCFACECAAQNASYFEMPVCGHCPIKKYRDMFNNSEIPHFPCLRPDEPYSKYSKSSSQDEACEYAKQISELEFTDPRED